MVKQAPPEVYHKENPELSKEEEIYLIEQVKQWYDEGRLYHVWLLTIERIPNPGYFINNSRNVLKSSDGIIRLDCEAREEADDLARKINANLGKYGYRANVFEDNFGVCVIVNSSSSYSFVEFAKSEGIMVFFCFIDGDKTTYACGVPKDSKIILKSFGDQFKKFIKKSYPKIDVSTTIKRQRPLHVLFTTDKSDPTFVYVLHELKSKKKSNERVNYFNLSETELKVAFVLNLLKRSNLITRNNQLKQTVRIIFKVTKIRSDTIKRLLTEEPFFCSMLPEDKTYSFDHHLNAWKQYKEQTENSSDNHNQQKNIKKKSISKPARKNKKKSERIESKKYFKHTSREKI